ncbi:protein SUOX-1, isoform a [Cladochytrium replicatum]|nr:protein SUOX-1, isoform a [Cladochytrium replicatum]
MSISACKLRRQIDCLQGVRPNYSLRLSIRSQYERPFLAGIRANSSSAARSESSRTATNYLFGPPSWTAAAVIVGTVAVGFAGWKYWSNIHTESNERSKGLIVHRLKSVGFGRNRDEDSAIIAIERGFERKSSKEKIDKVNPKTGLPYFTRAEVGEHNSVEKGIWVIYQGGVYDITEFVEVHPGGSRILMAAGRSIEPFWNVFSIHQSESTRDLLESYRIGDLDHSSAGVDRGSEDAAALELLFSNDPIRDPSLIVRSARPCNAESPKGALDSYITPAEKFFVRNHLPVPQIDPEAYKLQVVLPAEPLSRAFQTKTHSITLQELASLPQTSITATLQCAGNRRAEMHEVKPTKGLLWQQGAISTATWTGVLLRDVFAAAGYDSTPEAFNEKHLILTSHDGYGASVPLAKALNPSSDVLLATHMNGEPIPPDHGAPVRVIIPGVVAARSVKWLSSISLDTEESTSHWQRKDYKGFQPSLGNPTEEDYSHAGSIQETPVQSAIVSAATCFNRSGPTSTVTVKGYAYSGGGRGIERLDVSSDGGKTWHAADLIKAPEDLPRGKNTNAKDGKPTWAWTLWEAHVPVGQADAGKEVEFVCKAVDESYNSQPESMVGIYNVRGVLVNGWHRVKVNLEGECGECSQKQV